MNQTHPAGSGYFLYHSIGQYPGKAKALASALDGFAHVWGATDDAQWGYVLGQQDRFIGLWRDLIGAPEGTLTTAGNVTGALYSLIGSLPAKYLRGKRLLVAGDCFPSLHFLLTGLQDRFGFTLETVPLRPGAFWVEDEDVIKVWDETVGLALLTLVSSTSSHRCNLDALVAHARKMGSLVGVDITQSAGLVPYNATDPAVDFTVSSTLKWLCGTPGAGILHVAAPLIAECEPELRGWFSQANPFSWDLDKFTYAPDIRRFDNGTPTAVACIGSVPALEWHAAQNTTQLLAHTVRLVEMVIDGTDSLGLTLASPRNAHERGGSVMVSIPEKAPTVDISAYLRAKNIHVDMRGRILRISPGNITTTEGVEQLITHLGAALATT